MYRLAFSVLVVAAIAQAKTPRLVVEVVGLDQAAKTAAPTLANLTAEEKQGETLFQHNCAFCHAADGTGRNWIGSFLQPHPRNLTSATAMQGMTRTHLKQVIRNGLPGTTMPAWKSVLNDGQMDAVVVYVARAFHPLSASEARP